MQLWNPQTGERLAVLETGPAAYLTWIALSPSGRWLAAGNSEGRVRLWDIHDLRRQLGELGLDWDEP